MKLRGGKKSVIPRDWKSRVVLVAACLLVTLVLITAVVKMSSKAGVEDDELDGIGLRTSYNNDKLREECGSQLQVFQDHDELAHAVKHAVPFLKGTKAAAAAKNNNATTAFNNNTTTIFPEDYPDWLIPYGWPINQWCVGEITDFSWLFYDIGPKISFDVSGWDVSKATTLAFMFSFDNSFNVDLSAWDVHNVLDMEETFRGCKNFNQDLSMWKIHNVRDFRHMFQGARQFNQDLCPWHRQFNHKNVISTGMFERTKCPSAVMDPTHPSDGDPQVSVCHVCDE